MLKNNWKEFWYKVERYFLLWYYTYPNGQMLKAFLLWIGLFAAISAIIYFLFVFIGK